MKSVDPVQAGIRAFASGLGMQYRNGSWYLVGAELIAVVNLQRSQYSPRYYLNVGWWLRELGVATSPARNQRHVRGRAEQFMPDPDELHRLLDLDAAIADRERALVERLERHVKPVLASSATVEDLRNLYATGRLGALGIRGEALGVLRRQGAPFGVA